MTLDLKSGDDLGGGGGESEGGHSSQGTAYVKEGSVAPSRDWQVTGDRRASDHIS